MDAINHQNTDSNPSPYVRPIDRVFGDTQKIGPINFMSSWIMVGAQVTLLQYLVSQPNRLVQVSNFDKSSGLYQAKRLRKHSNSKVFLKHAVETKSYHEFSEKVIKEGKSVLVAYDKATQVFSYLVE